MTPEEIRQWFTEQQKEHECCCIKWGYVKYPYDQTRVMRAWIDFDQAETFADFFGIIDDVRVPATFVSGGICFNMEDVVGGDGFELTEIMADADH